MAIDEQKLEMKISDLEECINTLNENKEQLNIEYDNKKHQYVRNTYNNIPETFEIFEFSFEEAFNKVIEYLEIQIDSLKNYSNLSSEIKDTIISKNYNNILNEFDYPYDTSSLKLNVTNIDTFVDILTWKNLDEDYKRLNLLKNFSEIEEDIILIGGNGKGKTFLANFLKESEFNSISVIGSQKILNFYSGTNSIRASQKDIENSLLKNNIKESKNEKNTFDFFDFMRFQFTKLIIAMQVEYFDYLIERERGKREKKDNSTVFEKVNNIFNVLFKDIELIFTSGEEFPLMVEKKGKRYSVNGLSEGEKVVLYYAISVLMAKDDGLIIIDEPETYLNPSISNLLWDKLKEEKPNTQFVFITHSVDFVLGRSNAQIAWIKEFVYPDEWKLKLLTEENELPKQMLTEILGSSKPYLFCEGTKASHDYHIYKALFGEKYTIIPSEGHISVINNVKAVNELEGFNTAYGIIDLDNLTEDEIEAYRKDKIEVLQFNEIEMLFFEEHIMETFMKNVNALTYNSKIDEFKSKFFEEIEKNTGKIALTHIKKCVENYLSKEKIEEYTEIIDIENQLKKFSDFEIQDLYAQKEEQIKQLVKNEKYLELLKVCNLKGQITGGLANKFLVGGYIDKLKEKIIVDKELQAYIRNTYFSNLNY